MVINDTAKLEGDELEGLSDLAFDSGINQHTNTYQFDSKVLYKCLPNMKWSHDYNQTTVQATCQKGNTWKVPEYWGYCAACTFTKFIKNILNIIYRY